jgi:hypothetical protein
MPPSHGERMRVYGQVIDVTEKDILKVLGEYNSLLRRLTEN